MKCAKLQLQERSRTRPKSEPCHEKPRRYCQKLLVDPQFEENQNWTNTIQRYRCADHCSTNCNSDTIVHNNLGHHDNSDMFLSVQTLQFKGELMELNKRPRTSFKYKSTTAGQKHRMFVKQAIDESSLQSDVDRESELTSYFEDYTKYFVSNDQSPPTSIKSSMVLPNSASKRMQNKSVQVDLKSTKSIKENPNNSVNIKTDVETTEDNLNTDSSKITYHKRGKRKSITISKSESPETVQVIRVDVVCNYSCSSATSDYDDNKKIIDNTWQTEVENDTIGLHKNRYGNKYLLTKSVKALDENVSAGANVTLLCKTFRLADRSRIVTNKLLAKSPILG